MKDDASRRLTQEQLAEIEARANAATAAPWTIGFNGAMRSAWAILKAGTARTILNLEPEKNIELDELTHQVDSDLDFIQFARGDVDALLADIRARDAEVAPPDTSASSDLQETQVALIEIAQKCERLQTALEFYADIAHYRPPNPAEGEAPPLWIGNDLGRRAREALGVPEVIPEAPPTRD